ncbi:MAG: hypothetical protein ACREMY_26200, partial [bacterium]
MKLERKTLAGAAGIALLAASLALGLFLSFGSRSHDQANAAFDASLDFSISSTGTTGACNSSGSPTATCHIPIDTAFSVAFNMVSLPSTGNYQGYDAHLDFTSGISTCLAVGCSTSIACPAPLTAPCLQQQGAGNWTNCTFPASDFSNAGAAVLGCATFAVDSTYVGALFHL